jgi:hypothetical protein
MRPVAIGPGSTVTFTRPGQTVVAEVFGLYTDRAGKVWVHARSSDPEDYWGEPIENVREVEPETAARETDHDRGEGGMTVDPRNLPTPDEDEIMDSKELDELADRIN